MPWDSVEEIKLNVQAVEKNIESLSCNMGLADHQILTLEERVRRVETSLLSAATSLGAAEVLHHISLLFQHICALQQCSVAQERT